ncbi:alpha-lytic protease prodomain-containing protein [Streptomyces sp. gb1(2016)]|uniref:alpha-lytic protease prodomain-containing protein n=1 Tax=Streptomyces sp. gb1(2016) TaxID=1828321 RepID=UPI003966A51C
METTMLRRRAFAAGAAVLAAGTLALAGQTGIASAGQAGSAVPAAEQLSPGLLDAMSRDLGLDAGEARTRIADESRAAAVASALEKSLGADFAGARLSDGSAVLTVATTDPADIARITAAGARAEVVRHSLDRLDAAKAALDSVASEKAPKDVPSWYVDVRPTDWSSTRPVRRRRTASSPRPGYPAAWCGSASPPNSPGPTRICAVATRTT